MLSQLKHCSQLSTLVKPNTKIINNKGYEQALLLMKKLFDDDDNQLINIELLAQKINHWENISPKFAQFNRRIQ